MHQDGAVGPRGAVTLHGVAVVAVIVLVPEGAVLHHLFRCTQTVSRAPRPTSQRPRAQRGVPYSRTHPACDRAGGASLGKKLVPWHRVGPWLAQRTKGCKSGPPPPHPGHHPGVGLLEHSSGLEESRPCGPVAPLCTPAVFMSLPKADAPSPDSLVPNQLCPLPGSVWPRPGHVSPPKSGTSAWTSSPRRG